MNKNKPNNNEENVNQTKNNIKKIIEQDRKLPKEITIEKLIEALKNSNIEHVKRHLKNSNVAGSKFYFDNIKDLKNFLIGKLSKNKNQKVSTRSLEILFKNNVGTDSLISSNEIDVETPSGNLINKIINENTKVIIGGNRTGLNGINEKLLNLGKLSKYKNTNKITIIFDVGEDGEIIIRTIYPGRYADPTPLETYTLSFILDSNDMLKNIKNPERLKELLKNYEFPINNLFKDENLKNMYNQITNQIENNQKIYPKQIEKFVEELAKKYKLFDGLNGEVNKENIYQKLQNGMQNSSFKNIENETGNYFLIDDKVTTMSKEEFDKKIKEGLEKLVKIHNELEQNVNQNNDVENKYNSDMSLS